MICYENFKSWTSIIVVIIVIANKRNTNEHQSQTCVGAAPSGAEVKLGRA